MKNIVIGIFAVLAISITSCDKENNEEVQATYKLIEIYSDPGDGSGEFNPIQSNKRLEILNDNKVRTVNGLLCNFGHEVGQTGSGIIDQEEMTIVGDGCSEIPMTYTLEGDYLILTRLCIEGCAEKYERVL